LHTRLARRKGSQRKSTSRRSASSSPATIASMASASPVVGGRTRTGPHSVSMRQPSRDRTTLSNPLSSTSAPVLRRVIGRREAGFPARRRRAAADYVVCVAGEEDLRVGGDGLVGLVGRPAVRSHV